MSQLLQLIVLESTLYLRSKRFWLLAALTTVAAFIPDLGLLLIQFVVISAVIRDERSGFAPILSTLPHNTVKLFLARALAIFCLLLGLWPFIVLVTGFWGDPFLVKAEPAEWLSNGQHLAYHTLKYITTCAITIGFVFLAGVITRHPLSLYLIIGVCWVVGIWLASNLTYFPVWSMLSSFGYWNMLPNSPSTAVGYFPQQDLLPACAVYQGAMAILFVLFAAARQMRKRGEPIRHSQLLVSIALIAVTAGLAAGSTVWREFDNRESSFHLSLHEAESVTPATAKTVAATDPVLQSYHLDVKLHTAAHCLEGTANLKLKMADHPSDVILLTLRNCFTVKEIAIAGRNERLEWWREGSRLAVRIPEGYRQDEALTLTISYSGQVWEWFTGQLARPTGPVNFIAPSFSLLRSGYAWYPVLGDQPLYTYEYYNKRWNGSPGTILWAKRAIHPPVPFELTVDIDTDSTVVSNLEQAGVEPLTGIDKHRYHFSSLQGRDVFLITGPYHCEKRKIPGGEGFAEVYSYYQHQSKIDKVLDLLTEPYLFYRDMIEADGSFPRGAVQQGKIYTVVEMPQLFAATGVQNLTLTDAVLINENLFRGDNGRFAIVSELLANARNIAILQRWWQEDMTVTKGLVCDGNIIEGLMFYLYTLCTEEIRGQTFYRQVKQSLLTETKVTIVKTGGNAGLLPFETGGPIVRDVFVILDTIRSSNLGDPGVRNILRELYQVYSRKRNIDPADFAKVVEAVLARANWELEKTEEVRRCLENITRCSSDSESRKLKDGKSMNFFTFNLEEWLP